ncbi:MAG: cation transporter, partial [Bifidobacterium crudilactis]|nr:cation transporter [Bifidobacterium crudilactis]
MDETENLRHQVRRNTRSEGGPAEVGSADPEEAVTTAPRGSENNQADASSQEGQGFGHRRRLALTLSFTAVVLVAEVIGAYITGSLALLVDAGHMLTDVAVLTASLVTAVLMTKRPTSSKTWGWARLEVITAAAGA